MIWKLNICPKKNHFSRNAKPTIYFYHKRFFFCPLFVSRPIIPLCPFLSGHSNLFSKTNSSSRNIFFFVFVLFSQFFFLFGVNLSPKRTLKWWWCFGVILVFFIYFGFSIKLPELTVNIFNESEREKNHFLFNFFSTFQNWPHFSEQLWNQVTKSKMKEGKV